MYFLSDKKMSTNHINYSLENQQFTQQYQWTNHVIEYKSHSFTRSAYDKYNKRKVKVKCYINHNKKCISKIRYLKQLFFTPFNIKILNVFHVNRNQINIVTENYSNTLKSFLKNYGSLDEMLAYKILKQIVSAIYFLSKHNILHKHLTDSDIVICTKTLNIKIKNFDKACTFKKLYFYKNKNKNFKNLFLAPELINNKNKNKITLEKTNTWFIGLLLYKMLFNKLPFQSPLQIIFFPCIIPANKFSLTCYSFLTWCLTKNPQNRINLKQIIHHPWITKHWI